MLVFHSCVSINTATAGDNLYYFLWKTFFLRHVTWNITQLNLYRAAPPKLCLLNFHDVISPNIGKYTTKSDKKRK